MSSRQTKYLISSSWDFLRFTIFVTSPHCNTSYLHNKILFTSLHLLKKIKKIRLILQKSYGEGKQTILNFDNLRPICQLYRQPSYCMQVKKKCFQFNLSIYLFQHVFVLDHASIVLFPNKILN